MIWKPEKLELKVMLELQLKSFHTLGHVLLRSINIYWASRVFVWILEI